MRVINNPKQKQGHTRRSPQEKLPSTNVLQQEQIETDKEEKVGCTVSQFK